MNPKIMTFADNPAVATAFAEKFVRLINEKSKTQSKITVSLSGGSTPKLLFSILAEQYAKKVDWSLVHFFWGDERCVPPEDAESNFGEAHKLFLAKIEIPKTNIHRVLGEADPSSEAVRYAAEIGEHLNADSNGVPVFDILILGMGSDGHTASIFPHEIKLLDSKNICEVAVHPDSGQKRITITGQVLNAADTVCFLITGAGKADVLAEIMNKTGNYKTYPTSFINPPGGSTFYIDESAGASL